MSAVLDRIVRLGAVLRSERREDVGVLVTGGDDGITVKLVTRDACDGGTWGQTGRYATASNYDMACEALYAALYEEVEAERARLTAALD